MKSRKKTIKILVLSLIIGVSPWSFAMAEKQVVFVSASATFADALKNTGVRFNRLHPDLEMRFNFGAAGALAKQIHSGAPADIFISAKATWMDYLAKTNKLAPKTIRKFTKDSVVAVSRKGKPFSSLNEILAFQRIAIGSPGSTSIGEYTEQAFTSVGIYDTLKSQNKLVITKDVRQALLYAERGEVDVAFVFKTDARTAKQVKIVYAMPSDLHSPIVSVMALTVDGEAKSGAKAFYDFMGGADARRVFESYGYAVISAPAAGK